MADKQCDFCGTINDAHHSAECVDRRKPPMPTEYERFKKWKQNYGYAYIFPSNREQLLWLGWEASRLEKRRKQIKKAEAK